MYEGARGPPDRRHCHIAMRIVTHHLMLILRRIQSIGSGGSLIFANLQFFNHQFVQPSFLAQQRRNSETRVDENILQYETQGIRAQSIGPKRQAIRTQYDPRGLADAAKNSSLSLFDLQNFHRCHLRIS